MRNVYSRPVRRPNRRTVIVDDEPGSKALVEFVRRLSAFEAFDGTSLDKRGLADELSVSRPTAHRIITSFEELGVIGRRDGRYELTRYGEAIGEAALAYRDDVTTATALKVLLDDLPENVDFDYRLFSDAVVTEATYDDPFRPMNRFVELLEGAERIMAFNRSFLEPMYIELAHERIEAGTRVDVVYDPKVVELVLEEYSTIATAAFESDNVTASIHEELPIALAVFGDRVGVGIHTDSIGLPIAWIDTDDPEAVAWGEGLFERYRSEATSL